MRFWCLILLVLACSWRSLAQEEQPPHDIRVGKTTVAVANKGNTEIVIEKQAPKTVRFAARELKNFLDKMLGGPVPIVHQLTEGKVSFVLGINDWSRKVGLPLERLVPDAYIIRTVSDDIYIAGKDSATADPEFAINKGGVWSQIYERATLFGVYEFLERIGGVRMYFPGELGTIIPRRQELAIPALDIYDRPDFQIRKVSSFWDGTYFEGENPDAVVVPAKTLNSYYRLRLETRYIPCAHGTNAFKYIERFGKSHPEYFALLSNGQRSNDPLIKHSGQLCWTSGVLEEIYQDARAYLTGKSAKSRGIRGWRGKGYAWSYNCAGGKYVDVMPQDAFTGCRCPACQAAYTQGDDYATELIWQKTVDIATRLKREGIAGYVTQMAYKPYRRIPGIAIPDNVLVMVAENGPWSKCNPVKLERDNQEIRDWVKKLGRKVWLWTYVNKGFTTLMPGIPQMSPNAYAEYFQAISPWIFGAFAESESDRFLYNYLNYYVFAKIAWNAQIDYKELLQEHYDLMFGKASAEMKAYFELLEDIWITKILGGRSVDTPLGPKTVSPSDYELWTTIYTPELIAKIDGMLAKATAKVGKDTLEGRRIALFEREFQAPLKRAAADYLNGIKAVRGLVVHMGSQPKEVIRLCPFGKRSQDSELVSTQVQVWRNDRELGVRFVCQEPSLSQTVALKRAPDEREIFKDNSVEIFLNPTGDRKTYYQIMVNSAGAISDQKLVKHGAVGKGDFTWNSGARIQVKKQDRQWIMEALIPLTALPGIKPVFPVNFTRNRVLKQGSHYHILYNWSPFVRGFHDLENFGSLSFETDRNILIDSGFSLPAQKTKRHYGLWKGSKWLGGWIGRKSLSEQRDETCFVSAPASMRLKDESMIVQYLPSLKPNVRYRLSFYVKLENVTSAQGNGGMVANLWDETNRWFPRYNWMTGTTGWLFQSYEFKTGPKTNVTYPSYLGLRLMRATGTVWVDNVRLEELD